MIPININNPSRFNTCKLNRCNINYSTLFNINNIQFIHYGNNVCIGAFAHLVLLSLSLGRRYALAFILRILDLSDVLRRSWSLL